ncbi:MAG: hypothetical protein IJT96_10890 [Lachnospiraceae bacterium]|nr:hypothetical protein [Lachnospiraceae bacterium]
MNLQRIDEVPYFMDVFDKWTKEYPDSLMLKDDTELSGLTRRQVEKY